MDKASYAMAFRDAVETACQIAENALGESLTRDCVVRMYGAGISGRDVSPEEFIDRAYMTDEIFRPLIDICVVEVVGARPVVRAYICGFPPGPLSHCWNGDKGPFKQIYAVEIR